MLTKRDLLRSTAAIAAGAAIARPSLLMAQSYPGIIEAKDIAEEGFIYGLPLVMNYAVMHEFAVDTKSGQFKAPFNEINNLHHVATYEDTAVITPNSDTPYSMLWLDLRAEPMVISVPAVDKGPLLLGPAHRRQHLQFRLYRHAAPRGPSRATIWWSAPTGKAKRPPASRRSSGRPRRSCSRLSARSSSTPATCRTSRRCRPATRRSRFRPSSSSPAPPAAPKIDFLPATTPGIKDNFFDYLDAALQFVPETPRDKAIRAKLARIGVGPGKTFEFKDLRSNTKPKSWWA